MTSIIYRGFRYLIRHAWDFVNPRAIAWRTLQKQSPHKPVLTPLWKNLKVRIYPHDVIGKEIYVQGLFEPAECKLVMKFLKPGMVFFDIGANLGQYTLLAAQRVGPAGRVHSFEPSSKMFQELDYNVNLNGFSGICSLNQLALSNTLGTARLSRYEAGAEVYGSFGTQQRDNKTILGYETVETMTLDVYVETRNISRIDLIKMDIEGAELLALQGAKQILSKPNAPPILVEMADINTLGLGYPAVQIWDYLENIGYRFYRFDNQGRITKQFQRPTDFLNSENLFAIKDAGVSR